MKLFGIQNQINVFFTCRWRRIWTIPAKPLLISSTFEGLTFDEPLFDQPDVLMVHGRHIFWLDWLEGMRKYLYLGAGFEGDDWINYVSSRSLHATILEHLKPIFVDYAKQAWEKVAEFKLQCRLSMPALQADPSILQLKKVVFNDSFFLQLYLDSIFFKNIGRWFCSWAQPVSIPTVFFVR